MTKKNAQLSHRFGAVIIQDFYKTFTKHEQELLEHLEFLKKQYIPEFVKRQKAANIKQKKPFDPYFMATPLVKEVSKYAATVIVFVAFYLEGYIYQYATKHLSVSYFKKHLEKLPLKSKFIVIPQLVTGKQINTGSKAFQLLSELVAARNKLAHPKPIKNMERDDGYSSTEKIEFDILRESAHSAYKTIEELLIEFYKLSNDNKESKHEKLVRNHFKT